MTSRARALGTISPTRLDSTRSDPISARHLLLVSCLVSRRLASPRLASRHSLPARPSPLPTGPNVECSNKFIKCECSRCPTRDTSRLRMNEPASLPPECDGGYSRDTLLSSVLSADSSLNVDSTGAVRTTRSTEYSRQCQEAEYRRVSRVGRCECSCLMRRTRAPLVRCAVCSCGAAPRRARAARERRKEMFAEPNKRTDTRTTSGRVHADSYYSYSCNSLSLSLYSTVRMYSV